MPKTPSEKRLARFPWATLGRPESPRELFHKCEQQRGSVSFLKETPRVSIIVEAPGEADVLLEDTLASLVLQSYPHWEAAVYGGRPGEVNDPRFRWFPSEAAALRAVDGEWLLFIKAGDVLSPAALFLFLSELSRDPQAGVLYSHEMQIDFFGRDVVESFSKPAYSWFNLIHFNYLGRAWMARRDLWEKTKADFPAEFFLRADEAGASFLLVPYFLYYRRDDFGVEADETFRDVVKAHLSRKGFAAKVELDENDRLVVRPKLAKPEDELVSVVICFKDKAEWTAESLRRVCQSAGRVPVELFLVNNNSDPRELERVQRAAAEVPYPAVVVDFPGPFNFAEMHNQIVREHARGKYVLFLNNDVFWEGGKLEDLVAWAQFDWAGTVGMCLKYPHGDVQHGGLRAFFGGLSRLARIGHDQSEDLFTFQSREVFGNTFAASLVKKSTYEAVGGLRPHDLPNGFGDVAFNFECLRHGWKNLFLGHVLGTHLESASRGEGYEYWEEFVVEREYPDILQRMLREDLGVRRVPASDLSARDFVVDWITVRVRQKLPWLKPLKTNLKKRLRDLGLRGDNGLLKNVELQSQTES